MSGWLNDLPRSLSSELNAIYSNLRNDKLSKRQIRALYYMYERYRYMFDETDDIHSFEDMILWLMKSPPFLKLKQENILKKIRLMNLH